MTAAASSDTDLAALLDSWRLHLRSERKSPQTVKSYSDGVTAFLRWCDQTCTTPELSRHNLKQFTVDLLDQGKEAATVLSRHLACRRFSAWLKEEDEITTDQLTGLRGPKLDTKVVQPLSTDEIKRLLVACAGSGLRDRRDEALIRFMLETGSRAGETTAMLLSETKPVGGMTKLRGKGGKERVVPFGPNTARALDRYIRVRRTHRLAATDALWLGDRGKEFSYDGLHKALRLRAERAEVPRFHPHLTRHTMADMWLDKGGSEGGLMAVAGWERPEMLLRYTRGRKSARAVSESRRLDLGNF